MYSLYERVPVGGIVIFDDVMNHVGVMRFWKDFWDDHGLVEKLVPIDRGGAWFRKEKDVRVDVRKWHGDHPVGKD